MGTFDKPASSGATDAAAAGAPAEQSVCVLAYFRQIYGERVEVDAAGATQTVTLTEQPLAVEALHLAISRDGRQWTAINGNRPVLTDVWMRDPFVQRGPDGFFHLVATGGRGPQTCLYLRSRDLITWERPRALPVMESVPEARNIWVPEWFYDAGRGQYILFWSSSFEDAGWKKSRLWCCVTPDFRTFSEPRLMFAPPYSVIDGTMLFHEGTYYLFHKEEEFGESVGERRAIRLATSTVSPEGPYSLIDGPLNRNENGGQIVPVITEGPSIMRDPLAAHEAWLLLYGFCVSDGYGVSRSSNLREWVEESLVLFPHNARHGSVFKITPDELARLESAY